MKVEEITFKIPSKTSSGGYIEFSTGANNEVSIEIVSLAYDNKTPRTDVRIDPRELKKIIKILDAVYSYE